MDPQKSNMFEHEQKKSSFKLTLKVARKFKRKEKPEFTLKMVESITSNTGLNVEFHMK